MTAPVPMTPAERVRLVCCLMAEAIYELALKGAGKEAVDAEIETAHAAMLHERDHGIKVHDRAAKMLRDTFGDNWKGVP